jgi:hypothetical protein
VNAGLAKGVLAFNQQDAGASGPWRVDAKGFHANAAPQRAAHIVQLLTQNGADLQYRVFR